MLELSIIIPTRNRPKLLKSVLQSLACQSFRKDGFEVLVVDNGTFSETVKATQSFFGSIKNLRYVKEFEPGLHNARHRGMREAKADILVFADDDIETFPSWLDGIKESFADPAVALVGGKNLPEFEVTPPEWVKELWVNTCWGKILGHYSLLDFGDICMEIPPEYVWGCNFSIRKDILEQIGGFHPDGMPDNLLKFRGDGETSVSMAVRSLGYKAFYNPKASVYHRVTLERLTLEYLYKRSFAQGISDSYTLIRGNGGKIILAMPVFIYRRIKEFLALTLNAPSVDMYNVSKSIRNGYWDGVAYHVNEVKKDAALLKWVLKTDYRRS